MDVYDKEMEMYEKILPQLKTMLRDIADSDEQIFANTIHVSQAHSAILFEDLAAKDYRIRQSKEGFTSSQAKMILSKLAKFHALCATLQNKQPNVFANFKHGKRKTIEKLFAYFLLLYCDVYRNEIETCFFFFICLSR